MLAPATAPSSATVSATAPSSATAPAARAWRRAIAPASFDFKALLGDPPADDSAEHRREVDQLLAFQEARTQHQISRCRSEQEITVLAFSGVLGAHFNAQELPLTIALMQDVVSISQPVWNGAKRKWNRVRPPLADARIHPCVELERTASYPSGHATRGILWATLLSELFPDQREALLARGREIGDDRVLGGMHYPSDVAAGQKLGAEIARRLLANPDFRADLEEAKRECNRVNLRDAIIGP